MVQVLDNKKVFDSPKMNQQIENKFYQNYNKTKNLLGYYTALTISLGILSEGIYSSMNHNWIGTGLGALGFTGAYIYASIIRPINIKNQNKKKLPKIRLRHRTNLESKLCQDTLKVTLK